MPRPAQRQAAKIMSLEHLVFKPKKRLKRGAKAKTTSSKVTGNLMTKICPYAGPSTWARGALSPSKMGVARKGSLVS